VKEREKEMAKQWAEVNGGSFVLSGDTVPGLKAGYYRPNTTGGMMPQLIIEPVSLVTDDLIVLADFPVEHVVNGIKKFWDMAQVYKRNGLIHKRGYLMEGPPGTGKTSISNLIAKFFVENNGVVFYGGADNIASGSMQEAIKQFREIQKNPLLIVVEEFDTVMLKQPWKDAMMQLMDGANQIDNVVYLLATNFIEKIDQRFTKRPSRVDEIIHVGAPSATARKDYLRIMLEKYEGSASDIDAWVANTDGLLISHLKEAVVAVKILGQPLEATVERLRAMVPEKKTKTEQNKWAIAGMMENLAQAAYQAAEMSGETED
jgi:SpoVK/Ycf46/Vps4 family AAA+-type ATPase